MSEDHISYRDVMKEDLLKVLREVSRSYECRNDSEAWERVVTHPAPRFYIAPRRAHLYLSPMLSGDRSRIEQLSPLKREMYEALFETVQRLWQKKSFWGRSLNYVLQFAVMEPAPRFYISAAMMGKIWRERKRMRRVVCR